MLLLSLLKVLLLISELSCAFGESPGSNKRPRFSPFPDRSLCWTTPGLTKTQSDLCLRKPDVAEKAIAGIRMAYKECTEQFADHRWNCSSIMSATGNPYGSPMYQRGFKESAYSYAIQSAGVVIAVAKACKQNNLISCSCDAKIYPNETRTDDVQFKWKGCSDNLQYGIKFAKLFLDRRITGNDLISHVNLHNYHVGRLVVKNNVDVVCKCHGLSGSCTMKACWRRAPTISKVGMELKRKYNHAIRIEQSNSRSRNRKKPTKKPKNPKRRRTIKEKQMLVKGRKKKELLNNLVFYENSPNYCEANRSLDLPGTAGRRCYLNATRTDNCSNLCCGRGYDTTVRRRNDQKCKFVWCCKVQCENHFIDEEVTVCK